MKKIYIVLLSSLILLGLATFTYAQVQIPNPISSDNVKDLLLKIARGVADLIGVLGTIMIIVAGILYLTSAGDPGRMGKAKTALVYAIAGIAIALAAEAIISIISDIVGLK